MRQALDNRRSIHQIYDENEYSFTKRVKYAVHRCENVHEEPEKMTFSIDGLLTTTRMLVAPFLESQPRRDHTFEDLTQVFRAEGKLFCARTQQYKPLRNNYCSTRSS